MNYTKLALIIAVVSYLFSGCEIIDPNFNPNMIEIYGKTDSIRALVHEGATIDLGGKTYVMDKPLDIWANNITIKNGGLKRATTPVTYLSMPLDSGAMHLVVEETSEFRNGQWIKLITGPGVNQNDRGPGIYSIADINEDTLFFYKEWKRDMSAGTKVIRHGHIVRINQDGAINIRFENIVFHGNVQGNSHTHDWKVNPTMNMPGDVTVENCIFMYTPCENIIQCGGVIRDCTFFNLYGSFVHWACPTGHSYNSIVENNYGSRSNLATQALSGHAEGLLTFSSNSYNITVTGNHFVDGIEAIMGSQGYDDYNINVFDNYFENFPKKIHSIANNHIDSLDMSNNVFVDVGE